MKQALLLTYASALSMILLFSSPVLIEAGMYDVWETRQIRKAKQRSESYAQAHGWTTEEKNRE